MLDRLRLQREEAAEEGEPPAKAAEPERLLGELSKASQSLAEVLDSLTAQKCELETRVAGLEAEIGGAHAQAEAAAKEAALEVERAERAAAATAVEAAREAARQRARAERAEHLLAIVGEERRTTAFCVTVGRFARNGASREILSEAVRFGVDVRLSAHRAWRDSLLVAQAEGDTAQLQKFVDWAAHRFANAGFRESQVSNSRSKSRPSPS